MVRVSVVSIILLCGVVPCVLLGVFWIYGLFFSFIAIINGMPFIYHGSYWTWWLIFGCSLSGLAGTSFFIIAFVRYVQQKPWKRIEYILLIYTLLGAIGLISLTMNTGFEGNAIPFFFVPSFFAALIAYLSRYTSNPKLPLS
jgi:hypothetical protein